MVTAHKKCKYLISDCLGCLIVEAVPKAILMLMESDGLTIFQVKSHLKKYRIAKYMAGPAQGNFVSIVTVLFLYNIKYITWCLNLIAFML